MKIRRATLEDLDNIVEFCTPYFYESYWKVTRFSIKRTRERFRRYLTEYDSFVVVDEEILALAVLGFDYYCSDDLLCDYEFFYVSPSARGSGVSRVLREACDEFAKLKGAHVICACGSSGVSDGLWVNLFRKAGYSKLGTTMVKEL